MLLCIMYTVLEFQKVYKCVLRVQIVENQYNLIQKVYKCVLRVQVCTT